jgi:hypothetical protein
LARLLLVFARVVGSFIGVAINRESPTEENTVALRTGISIIAGSSAIVALGFVFSQWRARVKSRTNGAATLQRARRGASVPVRRVPMVETAEDGVSAQPTERWHDSIDDAYDASNPDDLGAEFLARAVQVPRDMNELESDLDASGLHVDVLGEDGLPAEALPNSWAISVEDLEDLSTTQDDTLRDDGPQSTNEERSWAGDEEVPRREAEEAVETEQWYSALQERPRRGARRT